jgi:hypothetical protein
MASLSTDIADKVTRGAIAIDLGARHVTGYSGGQAIEKIVANRGLLRSVAAR